MSSRLLTKRPLLASVVLALVAAFPAASRGGFAVTLDGQPVPVGSPDGGFRYSYEVSLFADAFIKGGNASVYFTIYDFAGFVAGSNQQPNDSDWAFSTAMTGTTQPELTPVDDPGIVNLIWTYTGNADIFAPSDKDLPIGQFSAVSIYGNTIDRFYTGQAWQKVLSVKPEGNGPPVQVDQLFDSIAITTGPVVPEPSSLLMAAVGGVCFFGRRKAGRFLRRQQPA